MASAAVDRSILAFHLLRVHVVFVRESLQPELAHLRGKAYPRPLSVYGASVTDDAHLARRVSKIFRVTIDAGVVAREDRSHAVIGPLMAEAAILGLGLVFGPRVIKWRGALDDDRLLNVEDRLNWRRIRRRSRRRLIGRRLLSAAASINAHERDRDYAQCDCFQSLRFCHHAALCRSVYC